MFMKNNIKEHIYNKTKSIPFRHIILLIWLCVIWGHSMQPANISSTESGTALTFINNITGHIGIEFTEHFIRKLAHFTEYTICGVLLSASFHQLIAPFQKDKAYKYLHLIVSLFCGLLVAMIDETIQLFSYGRSCEVKDVWLDFSGICLGTFMLILFDRLLTRRKA